MEVVRGVGTEPLSFHSLVTNLHFRPFTPHFRKVFNRLEINLGCLFEHLSSTFQVPLGFAFDATFLVEFSEVDVESVKIRRGFSRADCG